MTAPPRLRAALVAFAFLLPPAAGRLAAQAGLDTVRIQTIPAGKGVFMLRGAGGNIALSVGDDAAFLVDDQYAPLSEKILAAVRAVTDKPVRFLVNTHWHGDHTGGNENLAKAGVIIVAHDNVRTRMSTEQFNATFNRKTPASPKGALPVVTFSESVAFYLNDETIHVVHVPPAHTDGDALVHFTRANVLHMGDNFFNGSYPFVDVSSGGSFEGVIRAVTAALSYVNDSTKVIPGHGALAGKAELLAYRDVLVKIRDRVAALIKQGKTKEQVVAAKPTAEWDTTWGAGFMKPDVFLGIVYESMASK
ncbi:MAG TPA: MBL fold metallo-hydrolase [Gemmatimonadales bacterium]|nr:MBL fold metallo-hydrolase [Gemmatimonadales bacterium]